MSFKFNLGQAVEITTSAENGKVIARAEYLNSINSYLVRYRNGQGQAVEAWWTEDALKTTEEQNQPQAAA
jgi:hypothetical protein